MQLVNGSGKWLSGVGLRATILNDHQIVTETERSISNRIIAPNDTVFSEANFVPLPEGAKVDEVRVKVVQATLLNKRRFRTSYQGFLRQ